MSAASRILIAEDVPANIALYRAVLEKAGYDVEVAERGDLAAEMASAGRFDLVVMDIGLPGMDGAAAARRIRAHEAQVGGRRTTIIALTADDDGHVRRACRDAGMDGYLAKPISPAMLISAIREKL